MRKSWLGQLVSGVVLLSGMAMTAPADAETITVCIDGTCDFTDIQSAISIAANGDILEVGPGNYSLPASINSNVPVVQPGGKAIHIRGSIGPNGEPLTVIDGKGQRRAARCNSAEGPNTILENLEFVGGNSSSDISFFGCVEVKMSQPRFVNCSFRNNPDGGLYVEGNNVQPSLRATFDRCRFSNNTGGSGAKIRDCSPEFKQCVFSLNDTGTNGAAVSISAYAYTDANQVRPTFLDCVISFNIVRAPATRGAVYISNASPIFSDCLISDNSCQAANGRGGGIAFDNSATTEAAPLFQRCTIARNIAPIGGGVHIGTQYYGDDPLQLVDCSITDNSAQQGGGLFVSYGEAISLERCKIYSNSATTVAGGLYLDEPVVVTALESLICGNTSPIGSQIWGNGWPTGGNNCVNNSCSVCDPACVGDLNNDDLVDGADLGALLVAWGTNGSSQPGSDVNGDGVVDGADLGALLVAWGSCT